MSPKLFLGILLVSSLALYPVAGPTPAGGGLSGAIFTTDSTGTPVNANHYINKCDVYLDGGPGPNAPAGAAGLPDGDYYFQVTDPPGKTLLSTDPIASRQIQVLGGFFVGVSGSGNHSISFDNDHGAQGARVVQLCPYLDTPNPGGVYKVWVTPVAAYGPGKFFGFVPADSKTDNFKVKEHGGQTLACLNIDKYNDTTGNFVKDPSDVVIPSWPITVLDPNNVPIGGNLFTPVQLCNLVAGTYTVTESLNVTPFHWGVDWVLLDGVSQPATATQLVTIQNSNRTLLYGNGL